MDTNTIEGLAPLSLVPQYFGSIVYDRCFSRYFPFDRAATNFLTWLHNEPLEIVLSGIQNSQTRQAAHSFFDHFYDLGFFDTHLKFAGKIHEIDVPRDHLTGPLTLHLAVVDRCNLRCRHCFAGDMAGNDRDLLSLDELEKLFSSMFKMGSFRLGLTGGEPLLREDIFEIIAMALHYELSPCLTTNGLLITEDIARKLGELYLAYLNVSLESSNPQANDEIRGEGTFARVMKSLAILADHAKFSLAFTVTHGNWKDLQACVDLAYRVGAQSAVFRPIYPVGKALEHMELMPSFGEYVEAMNSLAKTFSKNDVEFCSVHPWGPQNRAASQSLVYKNFGCGAGNIVCSVSASGDVSPCSFLGHSYVAGNVRESSLEQIWHKSEIFQNIRLSSNAACENCSEFAVCKGGCRARALALNGSITAPDPWCLEGV